MISIVHKLKKIILLDVILFAIVFFLVRYILNLFNLEYRRWIFYIFALVIITGVILGIMQLIRKIKIKWVKFISVVLSVLLLITSMPYAYIVFALSLQAEHIVVRNEYEMVAYVNSWHGSSVSYYDYKNPFLHSKHRRLSERYSWTNSLPINDNGEFTHDATNFTWYDDNGKPIN